MSAASAINEVISSAPMVGLVDSGHSPGQESHVEAYKDFTVDGKNQISIQYDQLEHGSEMAQVIVNAVPNARLFIARVFAHQLITTAKCAGSGIDWLVDQGVRIINLSFGLHNDRSDLADACSRAISNGVIIVASAPAVGRQVYPASYPGVIRVTGDARCQPGEYSYRPSSQADYGACVRSGHPQVVGASVAAAYISATIARYCNEQSGCIDLDHMHGWLKARAEYQARQCPFTKIPCERRLAWDGGS